MSVSTPTPAIARLEELLLTRILVLDGAMGTMIQAHQLEEADFRGTQFANHPKELRGCNDLLSLTRPDIIEDIHRQYFEAGADIVETNTFNSTSISMAEYRLESAVGAINRASAQIARRAADEFTERNPDKPRFVAGSIGPTSRAASLSPDVNDPGFRAVTFDQLVASYSEQVEALIDGGVDILFPETTFDTLNLKACLFGISQVFDGRGITLPVMISATITDASGRTLSGQTVEAFWNSVAHFPALSVGLNCALGADRMRPYVEELARIAPCFVSCHPNAGLPNEFGAYDETPEYMGRLLLEFAENGWLNIVGGCCGTTPAHIRVIADAVQDLPPRPRPRVAHYSRFSGLEPLTLRPDSNLVIVGERTNVTGSKKFARLVRSGDYDAALEVAREQVASGANVLDINMDEALLDGEKAMATFLNLIAAEPDIARIPVMIDSSKWSVIESGLKCVQGKSIVNSISLKEGEESFLRQARLVRRYGAATVVMAFDEEGQAVSVDRKVAIAKRAFKLLTDEVGFPPEDVIFDPNILTVGTGIEEHANYAVEYIESLKQIKRECPGAKTSGGVSNVSFSFRGNEPVRRAMNAAFLYHAIKAGLDMGIVNAGQLDVYEEIDKDLLCHVEDVLFNRRADATERLVAYAETVVAKDKVVEKDEAWRKAPIEDRLSHALVNGIVDYIEADTEQADGPQHRGTIIMETVKGDVHDIGKNIVGVVLRCNNFEVIDLGVMVPTDKILDAAVEHKADFVGLSGLITPSLDEMVHVAKEMQRRGMTMPLLIGGATTSAKHTAVRIAPSYAQPVVHSLDASVSVPVVENLLDPDKRADFIQKNTDAQERDRTQFADRQQRTLVPYADALARRFATDWASVRIDEPAFLGLRFRDPQPLEELVPYIDWSPFFQTWELRGKYPSIFDDPNCGAEAKRLFDDAQRLLTRIVAERLLTARGVYGFWPANSVGDDILVYADPSRSKIIARFPMLRQQWERKGQADFRSLADYIAPLDSGRLDYIGAFAVTAGIGCDALAADFESQHDDYLAIMTKALADRLAEAFAEMLHRQARIDWGYGREEKLSQDELLEEKYRGIRPAFGYPACPDHTEKRTLFELLHAEEHTGIRLTESFAMWPAAAVSGLYFGHPEARYFSVDRITRDQVESYAARKGMTIPEVKRWLGPNLGYEPN